jgi:hypothetical protein
MSTQPIPLSQSEQALYDAIVWDVVRAGHDAQRAREDGDRALALFRSLMDRDAIPEVRRRYFVDAEYNPGGRGRSRLQGFERNGRYGDDIIRHPHFLKYLRYFILGCELPDAVVQAFSGAVEDCGPITSGDVAPLAANARALVRRSHLDPRVAAEEFFKLTLDCGLGASGAAAIRTSVLTVKPQRYG